MGKKSNKLLRDETPNTSLDALIAEFNKSGKIPDASPVTDAPTTYEKSPRGKHNPTRKPR